MKISEQNQQIGSKIMVDLVDTIHAAQQPNASEALVAVEDKIIALGATFIGAHLELLDQAREQTDFMKEIASSFFRIANAMEAKNAPKTKRKR